MNLKDILILSMKSPLKKFGRQENHIIWIILNPMIGKVSNGELQKYYKNLNQYYSEMNYNYTNGY